MWFSFACLQQIQGKLHRKILFWYSGSWQTCWQSVSDYKLNWNVWHSLCEDISQSLVLHSHLQGTNRSYQLELYWCCLWAWLVQHSFFSIVLMKNCQIYCLQLTRQVYLSLIYMPSAQLLQANCTRGTKDLCNFLLVFVMSLYTFNDRIRWNQGYTVFFRICHLPLSLISRLAITCCT